MIKVNLEVLNRSLPCRSIMHQCENAELAIFVSVLAHRVQVSASLVADVFANLLRLLKINVHDSHRARVFVEYVRSLRTELLKLL